MKNEDFERLKDRYPLSIDDALRVNANNCLYNALKLSDRYDILSILEPKYITGNFEWSDDSKKQVIFIPMKICEKEGFKVLNESPNENDKFYVVVKKGLWEGVEFFKVKDKDTIYKFDNHEDMYLRDNIGRTFHVLLCQPSTEHDYFEYLKKEAIKRFGDIKSGDKFKRNWIEERDKWPEIAEIDNTKREFAYNKEFDQLTFRGTCIYEKGKWAERVKEKSIVTSHRHKNGLIEFWDRGNTIYINEDIQLYLNNQLENYLNDDK